MFFFDLITVYEKGFGIKFNRFKFEVMWLGAWCLRVDEFLGLIWVRNMKILRVFFSIAFVNLDN